jgi:hypothetical protein
LRHRLCFNTTGLPLPVIMISSPSQLNASRLRRPAFYTHLSPQFLLRADRLCRLLSFFPGSFTLFLFWL